MSNKDGVNPNCPAHGCRARSQRNPAVGGRKAPEPVVSVGSSSLLKCRRPGPPASAAATQQSFEAVTGGLAGLEIGTRGEVSEQPLARKVTTSVASGNGAAAGKIAKPTGIKNARANNPTKKASAGSSVPKLNKGSFTVGASGRTSTSSGSLPTAPKVGSVASMSSNKTDNPVNNPADNPKVAPVAVRRVVRRVRVVRACAPRG